MTAKLFLEAIGEVDDKYYMEAAEYEVTASNTRKARVLRLAVRVAVAAALIAALTVTAYAVYQAVLKDYFLDPAPTNTAEPNQESTLPLARLSMVGYQGTPEYNALKEWLDWMDEHPSDNYVAPDGNDDNADYKWPDYHPFYGAYYTEQGEALDAILDKYDLKPHKSRAGASAEEIYDALGTEPILSGEYIGSGYVYDDGTFNLELRNSADKFDVTIFASVKGTLTDIQGFSSPIYDEWSYTVSPSGEIVDLVIDSNGAGIILFETDGAYILVHASHDFPGRQPITREELEDLANSMNFSALSKRFDGSTHLQTAKKVAALLENAENSVGSYMALNEPEESDDGYIRSISDDKISETILNDLGRYTFSVLPDDFADTLAATETEQKDQGAYTHSDSVSGTYSQGTRRYELEYVRFHDLGLDSGAYLDIIRKTLVGVNGTINSCKVNEHNALLWVWESDYTVYWYDTEAELLFISSVYSLEPESDPVTEEEAISVAESVNRLS